jgi:hypothetical protein
MEYNETFQNKTKLSLKMGWPENLNSLFAKNV